MGRRANIVGTLFLAVAVGTAACVRPEPQAVTNTDTEQPSDQPPTADQGVATGVEAGTIALPTEAPVDNGTEQPEPVATQVPSESWVNYIREGAIPTTLTTTGIQSERIILSDIPVSHLLNLASDFVGQAVLVEADQAELEGATIQLRPTSNLPVTVNFYNGNQLDEALEDIPLVSAGSSARQDLYANATVIYLALREDMPDMEANFNAASQLFMAVLETGIDDPVRNENLTIHITESLGLAYACAKNDMTYEDYVAWHPIGAYDLGLTDTTLGTVTKAVYTTLQNTGAVVTILTQ